MKKSLVALALIILGAIMIIDAEQTVNVSNNDTIVVNNDSIYRDTIRAIVDNNPGKFVGM